MVNAEVRHWPSALLSLLLSLLLVPPIFSLGTLELQCTAESAFPGTFGIQTQGLTLTKWGLYALGSLPSHSTSAFYGLGSYQAALTYKTESSAIIPVCKMRLRELSDASRIKEMSTGRCRCQLSPNGFVLLPSI